MTSIHRLKPFFHLTVYNWICGDDIHLGVGCILMASGSNFMLVSITVRGAFVILIHVVHWWSGKHCLFLSTCKRWFYIVCHARCYLEIWWLYEHTQKNAHYLLFLNIWCQYFKVHICRGLLKIKPQKHLFCSISDNVSAKLVFSVVLHHKFNPHHIIDISFLFFGQRFILESHSIWPKNNIFFCNNKGNNAILMAVCFVCVLCVFTFILVIVLHTYFFHYESLPSFFNTIWHHKDCLQFHSTYTMTTKTILSHFILFYFISESAWRCCWG